jgi:hypothetical protein
MTVASGDLIGGGMDDVEKGVEALWHDWRRDPARKYPQCIKPQLYTKVAHNVEEGQISPIYGAAHRWFTAVLEKPAVTVVGKENSRLFEYFANRGDPKFPLHLVELGPPSTVFGPGRICIPVVQFAARKDERA